METILKNHCVKRLRDCDNKEDYSIKNYYNLELNQKKLLEYLIN